MISLYPHQQDLVDRVRTALLKHRRVILEGPPGIGKTRMTKHILDRKFQSTGGRALFAVHRRGLVENASNSFREAPSLDHGIIMAGEETSFGHRLQVASIDTLNSWWCEGDDYRGYDFDFIVFDECHSHCTKLQTFLKYHDAHRSKEGKPPAYVLGLSATPQGEGLSDTFREIVSGPKPQWLIDNGYLKQFSYYEPTTGRLDLLVKKGGEFTKQSNIAAMAGLSGDLVRDWQRYAEGRATVGFFACRAHAKEAKEMLVAAGIDAQYVDGETPDEERRFYYKLLNQGDIDYLCNVGVIERGTDIPRVSCVQLCTAIGSIVRYRQMIGRGSRPHPEFRDCLVLDHAGNVSNRHGYFEDAIAWSLENKVTQAKDAAERPIIRCPNCNRLYRGGKCIVCDYTPSTLERKAQGLAFDGTELRKITVNKERVLKAISNEKLMLQSLYRAAYTGKTFRQAIGIAYYEAKKRGQTFTVPAYVEIGDRRIDMVKRGSPDQAKRVSELYPWTVRRRS